MDSRKPNKRENLAFQVLYQVVSEKKSYQFDLPLYEDKTTKGSTQFF